MMLGLLPHDPVAVALAPMHVFGAVPPSPVLDRSLADFGPLAYGNLTEPDCTAAAYANCARGFAHLNGFDLVVAPDKPLSVFRAVAGSDTADGVQALSVLRYQDRNGFDIGPQKLVAKYGTIPINRVALARSMEVFGLPWLGVTLHEREMDTAGVWDVEAGRDDGALVGGHMIPAWCYGGLDDGSIVTIGTWGRWQPVTWAWLLERLDEAWGLVWRQLQLSTGLDYAGLTIDGLCQELAEGACPRVGAPPA